VDDATAGHIAKKDNPHGVTKAQVGLGNADNTKDADKPISTATQAALNGKANTNHNHDDVYQPVGDYLTAEADPTVPAWAKAASKPAYTASEVGAVPTTREINGKVLSADVTLSAADVGADAAGAAAGVQTNLTNHTNDTEKHITTAERNKWDKKLDTNNIVGGDNITTSVSNNSVTISADITNYVTGSYTGTGEESVTLNLGFKPKFGMVMFNGRMGYGGGGIAFINVLSNTLYCFRQDDGTWVDFQPFGSLTSSNNGITLNNDTNSTTDIFRFSQANITYNYVFWG
jgi:hypothetical protein